MLQLLLTGTSTLNIGGYQFLEILLLIFGLFLILAGAFTAYFGSGKSRSIGVGLLAGGIVVGVVSAYWYHIANVSGNTLGSLLWFSFLVIVAAVIGALAAVAIFLVAIMKS
jgi:hypothetical protein